MPEVTFCVYNIERPPSHNPRYASRIAERKWEQMRPVIESMFARKLTKSQILDTLRQKHDFHPSMGQLVAQIAKWDLKRYKPRNVSEIVPCPPDEILQHVHPSCLQTLYVDDLEHYLEFNFFLGTEPASAHSIWKSRQRLILSLLTSSVGDGSGSGMLGSSIRIMNLMIIGGVSRPKPPHLEGDFYPVTLSIPVTIPGLAKTSVNIASGPQVLSVRRRIKSRVTIVQLQQLRQRLVTILQQGLSHATTLEAYDIALLHIIMCLAAEAIANHDQYAFEIHRQGAHTMLSGILHHWGPESHLIFRALTLSLHELDAIDLSYTPEDWLERVFRKPYTG